ncbi:Rgg family transcriptional regulator [Streptococcus ictaluri]|uniref:Transcriptional activator, Rgg/GadR/MutR family, C-terminal domain protein n=1 Tax=Streptococcus ictaluri 707-05 TaxID=764299 RepID=G5K5U7_9STRE|nr:Rgg/GadR/MutR family transcriptional regulator [Streptococcus ictaluri]EHI68758.1 transcriptional activator, Rgg/GadR/MutR family, C-terminal domain protein [Streptococcus ictaluri 707-05]
MLNKDLGLTFRQLRINRKIPLSQVANEHVSLSQISRFERGQCDISLSKFLIVLNKIHVEVKEFMDTAADYQTTEQIHFMSQLIELEYKRDINGFRYLQLQEKAKFEENPKEKRYYLNMILLQAFICKCDPNLPFPKAYLDDLTDYLFTTENWHIYELILIGNCYLFIDIPLLDKMGREILTNYHYYKEISTNKYLVTITLMNIWESCIHRHYLKEANFYQKKLFPLLKNETKLYEKTLFLFLKGLEAYRCGDALSGIQDMTKAIDIFDALGCSHHAQNYRQDFETFVGPLS